MLKFELDFGTVLKLGSWAGSFQENVDFLDYLHNLSLSKTKTKIESCVRNNINAFHWTRWQEDFEEVVDGYAVRDSDTFTPEQREWFACYTQYLVYALQTSSKEIFQYYDKDVFLEIMNGWARYHTFGVDLFVETVITKYGKPPNANVTMLCM